MHLPNLNSSSNKAFKKSPSQDPPSYNESVSSSPISLTPQNSRSRVPTMNSIGTSSSTSLSSGKKKKNVPYRPTPEQQRQIDLLTNPSSSSSSSLSSPPPLSSSSRKNHYLVREMVIVDQLHLLLHFQQFQVMHKQNILMFYHHFKCFKVF